MNRFLLVLLLSFPIFSEEINDPFEDLNRDIFIFNEKLDEKLLKPAALTYRKVTPQKGNLLKEKWNSCPSIPACRGGQR